MSYASAIVLAAGEGVRFSRFNHFSSRIGIPTRISKMIKSGKSNISKPLIEVNSKPVIIYCLNTVSKHPFIRDIVVVANPGNLKDIISKIKEYQIRKIKDVVLGGRLRQHSVINGLKAINPKTELVLIHDGVRPFIDQAMVSSVIKAAKSSGAAIVGLPVKATIKEVHGSWFMPAGRQGMVHGSSIVKKTLNRDNLWEVQTPQVFRKDLILEAYKKFGNKEVTDDAALVEKLGTKVKIVMGSYFNIKITTPEDLIIAEAIAKAQV